MSAEIENASASAIELWFRQLAESGADPRLKEAACGVMEVFSESSGRDGSSPFVTVVMRTQGRKLEAFQDALLTLYGQTDQDFEVLVMAHNVEPAELARIVAIIDRQSPSFRQKVALHEVRGEGRSLPLNAALERGKGEYFAFFDDDDLLFGHWVETFKVGARQTPGRLIRTVAATQQVEAETWSDGRSGYRSTTWPKAEYLKSFEYAQHLERNHTPFMSVAFPRQLFSLWGERFDEELDVCEDWDMILRGAFLLGVNSIEELTAIYRLWTGVTSSYTEHEREAWRRSEARVRARQNDRPTILPEGASISIVQTVQERDRIMRHDPRVAEIMSSTSWKVTAPMRRAVRLMKKIQRRAD